MALSVAKKYCLYSRSKGEISRISPDSGQLNKRSDCSTLYLSYAHTVVSCAALYRRSGCYDRDCSTSLLLGTVLSNPSWINVRKSNICLWIFLATYLAIYSPRAEIRLVYEGLSHRVYVIKLSKELNMSAPSKERSWTYISVWHR